MAVRPILRLGEPLLFETANEVTDFTDLSLQELLVDMRDTMASAGGVGIAAPQIGVSQQVVIFGFEKSERYPEAEPVPTTVLINPKITPLSDEESLGWEGCLSVPGLRGEVPRFEKIRYTGFDEHGVPIDRTVSGFHARVVQHECDHLIGRLFPSRVRNFNRFGFTDVLFPNLAKGLKRPMGLSNNVPVAGIDIGGRRKGCHLVVLHGSTVVSSINSNDPEELIAACRKHGAVAVGVDSPCRWGLPKIGRLAERALAREKISSFSTPTREIALANAAGFYDWMFSGETVFRALEEEYALLDQELYPENYGKVCFETFPHAITCAILGTDVASAKIKGKQRRQMLEAHGIDTSALKSVDAVDAALCAWTAQFVLARQNKAYGDASTGLIFVPQRLTQLDAER